MRGISRGLKRLALPALALLVLGNAGCLLAVAGVAGAGAAAAGYAYNNGLLYRDYHNNLADTNAAVKAAMQDLQFPVIEQKGDTGYAYVKTRTADGHTVRIHLDVVPSPIPVEGPMTRVGIRVGVTGDEEVSRRILDQVNLHLGAPPPTGAEVPVAPVPTGNPVRMLPPQPIGQAPPSSNVRPVSYETLAPPLAPAVPTAPTTPPAPVVTGRAPKR